MSVILKTHLMIGGAINNYMKLKQYITESTIKKDSIKKKKDTLKVKIIDRYNKDSKVTLEELRELATANSVDFETVVNELSDILHSFLYSRKENREYKVDKKELAKGTEHELEHTTSRDIAELIARDHLIEVPNYYTLLDEIEPED